MIESTARPRREPWRPRVEQILALAGALALAAIAGAAAATQPLLVLALVAAVACLLLAFAAPVTHLSLLIFMTAVAGNSIQQRVGGSVLPSDVLLLTGLLRAAVVLLEQR